MRLWAHRYSNAAFPFDRQECGALNTLSLHPRILALIGQLLGVAEDQLRLTQCFITAKFGGKLPPQPPAPPPSPAASSGSSGGSVAWDWRTAADHQPMHRDVLTNSMLEPARDSHQWAAPEDVQAILYYADVEDAGGPTACVLRGIATLSAP